MITQSQLRQILLGAGLPATLWQLPDDAYEPVTPDFVVENWNAWLDALPPELITWIEVGGVRRRVPRWVKNSGDCDNLAFRTTAHAQTGNALAAVTRNQPRGGLAYGFLLYVAGPKRPANFDIEGGHSINWFIEPTHGVLFFEPGRGEFVDLNAQERSSSWFGFAA